MQIIMQVKNTDIIVFRGNLQTLRLSEIGVSVMEVFACGGDATDLAEPASPNTVHLSVALVGFQGGETGIGKLGCGHLVREQKRE